jgi:signal transduction histidine kinase
MAKTPNDAAANPQQTIAELQRKLAERTAERDEALERQTATADVLKVISSSLGDLEPVFKEMLENAIRICEAHFGNLWLCEGDAFRLGALYGAPAAFSEARWREPVIHPGSGTGLDRVAKTKQLVHIADLASEQAYIERVPSRVALVELAGARTYLMVPMLKDDELVGSIAIYRQEVRPFSNKQIELVTGFADQAVIAIENARLLSELQARTRDLSKSLENLRTAQDRLVQTEKLASLGQLTAGIAHEIKNPLNFVNNFSGLSAELAEELEETLASAPLDQKMRSDVGELTRMLKSNLEKVVHHGKRADSIVKNMLLHSREGSGECRSADINALVEESLNLAYHGARAEKPGFSVTLERYLDPDAGEAEVYPQEITRALLNLISNGFYAAAKRRSLDGDTFEPVLTATTKNRGRTVEIRIRDNGTGIPDEVKEKIFNPSFTTKPSGEGTGLGLSMSHDIIVKQHGGSIDVETKPGLFTEFKIVLPRASQS